MHTWALHGQPLDIPLPWTDHTVGVTRLIRMGEWGVDIFFVLSGFLLAMPFLRNPQNAITWASCRQFWLRRALRVLPAYYFAILVLLYLLPLGLGKTPTAWETLQHTLFINPWFDTPPLRGAFWSLPVEAYFYVVLPALVLIAQRTIGIRNACLLLIPLCIAFRWQVVTNDAFVNKGIFLFSFFGRVDQFAIGILCAALTLAHPIRNARTGTLVLIAAFIGLLLFISFIGRRGNMFENRDVVYYFHQTVVALLAAAIVYASCSASRLAKCLFGNPAMLYIGTISYSMYLWHTIVLDMYVKSGLHTPQLLVTTLFTWPPILIVSICSYTFIERPFLKIRHGETHANQSFMQRHPARILLGAALALVALTTYNWLVQPGLAA